MDAKHRALRSRVQEKSKEIGHCVCKPDVTCPCSEFLKEDVCRCAGEGGGWKAVSRGER